MAQTGLRETNLHVEIKKLLKRELTLLPLFGLIYFTVSGGPFGTEIIVSTSGPGLTLILLFITPVLFSVPTMFMVRELQSMMPVEGGYYHWLKQAFGPFVGFLGSWMNWVVAWVDVSIYPVLAAYYLSAFFPPLQDGMMVGNIFLPGWILQWFTALVLIWGISLLNIRGARLSGLFVTWMGLLIMMPIAAMSIVGTYNWIATGMTLSLPFLAGGQALTSQSVFGALSTGLYITMWNFMGWELPTTAGDEFVNPKHVYPLAMFLVLFATLASYSIPIWAGLQGGAGTDRRYEVWGVEEANQGEGIGPVLIQNGINDKQMIKWKINPMSSIGWLFPDIARIVGEKAAGQGSLLAKFLETTMLIAAILSMIGLFIGNGLNSTRVPFALAQDGMMPQWMVNVHPQYGTPWIAIIFCGVIFSIFSMQTFKTLIVIDVFLSTVVLMAEFIAMWVLRFKWPTRPRQKVPGGYAGLTLVTLAPTFIIGLAIYSQYQDEGLKSIGWALGATAIGVMLYFSLRAKIKPKIKDVNPFESSDETE